MIQRRQVLPKLDSKQELKKILRKYENSPEKFGYKSGALMLEREEKAMRERRGLRGSRPAIEWKKRPLKTVESSGGDFLNWKEGERG